MKILVELEGGPNNANIYVEPLGELFRGKHIATRMNKPQKTQTENYGIPDIVPGFYIEFDLRARKVTVYDPLSRPDFKQQRAALETYLSGDERRAAQNPNQKFRPRQDVVIPIPEGDSSTLMMWLLFLYRICTAATPLGILHSGEFPKEVVEHASQLQIEAANARRTSKVAVPDLAFA